jgi:hypothetical protein
MCHDQRYVYGIQCWWSVGSQQRIVQVGGGKQVIQQLPMQGFDGRLMWHLQSECVQMCMYASFTRTCTWHEHGSAIMSSMVWYGMTELMNVT